MITIIASFIGPLSIRQTMLSVILCKAELALNHHPVRVPVLPESLSGIIKCTGAKDIALVKYLCLFATESHIKRTCGSQ